MRSVPSVRCSRARSHCGDELLDQRLLQLRRRATGPPAARWRGRPARATSACTSLCSRPWTDSISLSALALRSATSWSRRARPSTRRRSACASASASMRWRSASMSPLAWPGSTPPPPRRRTLAVAASSSCAWMRAVRSAIIFLTCGPRELPQQEGDDQERQRPPDDLGALREDQLWCDCVGSSSAARIIHRGWRTAASADLRAHGRPRPRHVPPPDRPGDPAPARRPAAATCAAASATCVAGRGLRRLGLGGRRRPVASPSSRVDLGQPGLALALQRLAGGVDAARWPRPEPWPARRCTRPPRPRPRPGCARRPPARRGSARGGRPCPSSAREEEEAARGWRAR